MSNIFSAFLSLFLMLNTFTMAQKRDTIIRYDDFKSEHVVTRTVDVWLPPGYSADESKRFAVLYMHDGQNLFDAALAYGGEVWGVDTAIRRLSRQGKIPEMIVVGVWNTFYRFSEYMPEKPFRLLDEKTQEFLIDEYDSPPKSDAYLSFLVTELKPFIDQNYRTLPDRDNTLIMGSSMGGLISIYALCEYPEVFGRAGCLSTHWIGSLVADFDQMSGAMASYLDSNLPAAGNHRIYFDYGTLNLDSLYEPHQIKIDAIMRKQGYRLQKDWITKEFPGHDHNEKSWRARLNEPLLFLAGEDK
jgi:predicted alpha/beta superfamily hydrolase